MTSGVTVGTAGSLRAPTLIGVGVGPGDPELVTVKGIRILRAADVVLVPVMGEDVPGRAEATVRAHVEAARIRKVVFALTESAPRARREDAWDAAAAAVVAAFDGGAATVAFATLGDPNVYSTFTYLAASVRALRPDVVVETVPGITAMQDLAARSATVLCEGSESLALLPLTAGLDRFREALAAADTVVAYKGGRLLPEMLAAVREAGRLDDAVYGAALGLPDEDIRPAKELVERAELAERDGRASEEGKGNGKGEAPYLSTVIVPARRERRGGKL